MIAKQQYDGATVQARRAIDLHVEGENQWDAYRKAGFRGKTRQAASGFFTRLRPATDYRRDQLSKESEKRHSRAIDRLERVVNGNLQDVFTKGLNLTDVQWDALPREIAWLVESVEVDRHLGKVKLKFKSWSEAEKMLARIAGYDKPLKLEIGAPGDFRAEVADAIGGTKIDRKLLALALGEDPEIGDEDR